MYAHARAPIRIGIAGGGTDLPAWLNTGRIGRCLTLAIKMYTHASAITRPDQRTVAAYRKLDDEPAATEIGNGLIRESALMHGWKHGFEIHTISEMSSYGTGLGVSSSIAVSLAACFSRMNEMLTKGDSKTDPHKQAQAEAAWCVEIERLGRPIGRQDHMAAAHGGLNIFRFEGADAAIEQSFSHEVASWLASHLILVKLPDGHDSRAILSRVTSTDMIRGSAQALEPALKAVANRDPRMLGYALNLCSDSKMKIPGAVPKRLCEIIADVLDIHGTFGCKVAGAGGGGHLVVAVEHQDVAEQISQTIELLIHRVEPDLAGVKSDGWL